jgi:hypothetical protein
LALRLLGQKCKAKDGSSVALFWTSQGLHNLGEAIAPGTEIPGCSVPEPPECDQPKPRRNAAYVFKYNETNGFSVLPKPDEFIQCFNWATFRAQGDMSHDKYFCGSTNSNLTVEERFLYLLHGRICAADGLMALTPEEAGYYGYCVSPSPAPTP